MSALRSIVLSRQVARAHPQYRVGALLATNLHPSRLDPGRTERLVNDTLRQVQSEQHHAKVLAECAAWREVYRRMGLKASKTLCSLESLYKRVAKGVFPRINPVVDLYNLACLRWALCFGAYDTAAVQGGIEIRYGRGEQMEQIGGGALVLESTHVVYADAAGPLCAYWNHRDADRSKVTADSADVVFFADELGSNGTRSDAALHELGEWLAAAFGPAIELRRPAVEIQGD